MGDDAVADADGHRPGPGAGGSGPEKHCIKRADRLLSNAHLQGERPGLYQTLARRLVGAQRHPVILIDWSDLDVVKRHQVLRASLLLAGRALTLYEEVHGRATAARRSARPNAFSSNTRSGCRRGTGSRTRPCMPRRRRGRWAKSG